MRTLLIGMLAVSLFSCAGTESGNPGRSSQISIQGRTSKPADVSIEGADAALNIRTALVSFTDLSLVPCAASDTRPLAEPALVDLTSAAPPRFSLHNAPERACGVRLGLGPALRGPDAILERTVYLAGAQVDAAPFELVSTLERRAELSTLADEGFDPSHLVIAFDLALWLAEVDVHGAVGEGIAVINAETAPERTAIFESRIGLAAEVFADENSNGVLDEGESVVARGTD